MTGPLITTCPVSLTPRGFLQTFSQRVVSSTVLRDNEIQFLLRNSERALGAGRKATEQGVVFDYWYLLASHFIRSIPNPVEVRVYEADRILQPFDSEPLEGGYPFTPEAIPSLNAVFEVRCRSHAFDSVPSILPQARNFEIGLWQIEQGFRRGQKLVVLGGLDGEGVMRPDLNRRMAFRLAPPALLSEELRKDQQERSLETVSMNDPATFREYEFLLRNRKWPTAYPIAYENVDDEGPQHPVYYLYHDLSHLGLRSSRSRWLQDLSHLILRAGLQVFPEVDGKVADEEIDVMRRFFSGLIELSKIYFEDQLAESLFKTERKSARYRGFLSEARRLVASYASDGKATSILRELDRQLEAK